MFSRIKIRIFFLYAFHLLLSLDVVSQQKFIVDEGSKLVVSGTSSLHDWSMESNKATGDAVFTTSQNRINQINEAVVSMEVTSLKSGKRQMDNNTYNTLSAKLHPTITFRLKQAEPNGNKWNVTGDLTIAGVTRLIKFELSTDKSGQNIQVKGNADFKLTDFEIDPPTAVFGTIKTGDNVRLDVEFTLKPIE